VFFLLILELSIHRFPGIYTWLIILLANDVINQAPNLSYKFVTFLVFDTSCQRVHNETTILYNIFLIYIF